MNPSYSHIVVVLDRSGSMSAIRDDMIGGFNTFLAEQKALPGKATLTLVRFDDLVETVYDFADIQEVAAIDTQVLQPRGNTALYDAIGRTIIKTGDTLHQFNENQKPSKVIFLIITDGEENASKEFSQASIAERITHQRETYSWEFVFLGANQDAITKAKDLGIASQSALSYAANAQGARKMMRSASRGVSGSRAGGQSVNSVTFDDDDREEQKKAGLS